MTETRRERAGRGAEAGFTLVEALVAIVVLVFGLMAVTNLMLVAASSNSVANQGTASVASAIRAMDMIKATSFNSLTTGGMAFATDDSDPSDPNESCSSPTLTVLAWHCNDVVPGVGTVHTHWWITATDDPRLLHVRAQSEGTGALSAARSRADFTSFRACTNAEGGCPTVGATP